MAGAADQEAVEIHVQMALEVDVDVRLLISPALGWWHEMAALGPGSGSGLSPMLPWQLPCCIACFA